MTYVAAVMIAASAVLAQGKAREASPEDLKELGNYLFAKSENKTEIKDITLEGICKPGDALVIRSSVEWAPHNTCLIEHTEYEINGKVVANGTAIIGWDAIRKQIVAHYFDNVGGCSQAVIRKQGKKWRVRNNGIWPDGRKISSVVVHEKTAEDTIELTLTERQAGDETLPDETATIKRVPN